MNFLHTHIFIGLLHAYGYAGLALVVGLESLGLPLPGEGLLIMAAVYAGSTPQHESVSGRRVGGGRLDRRADGGLRLLASAWVTACCAATARVSA